MREYSGLDTPCSTCGGPANLVQLSFSSRCISENGLIFCNVDYAEQGPSAGPSWTTRCSLTVPHVHRRCRTCGVQWDEHAKWWAPVPDSRDALLADINRAVRSAYPDRGDALMRALEKILVPEEKPLTPEERKALLTPPPVEVEPRETKKKRSAFAHWFFGYDE